MEDMVCVVSNILHECVLWSTRTSRCQRQGWLDDHVAQVCVCVCVWMPVCACVKDFKIMSLYESL